MKRTLRLAIVTGLAGLSLGTIGAGTASAAHCSDNGGPGNSDFAAHVRASNGSGDHNEGQHQGWSSCEEQAKSGGR